MKYNFAIFKVDKSLSVDFSSDMWVAPVVHLYSTIEIAWRKNLIGKASSTSEGFKIIAAGNRLFFSGKMQIKL